MTRARRYSVVCALFPLLLFGFRVSGAYGDTEFGGTGGGPIAGSLTVRVIESEGEEFRQPVPIEGAMVMVGIREEVPFAGNVGFTDADGYISFIDPALEGAQTVTAGADGFGYFTLMDVDATQIVLPLEEYDPAVELVEVDGYWAGFSGTDCDDIIHAGFTLPTIDLSKLMGFDLESLLVNNDCHEFPIIGELPVPGALVIPDKEFPLLPEMCWLFGDAITIPDYMVEVQRDTYQNLFGFVGQGDASDIFYILQMTFPFVDYAEIITLLEPVMVGMVRDVYVDGPASHNIYIGTSLEANLTVTVDNAPDGNDGVFILSAGEINGDAGTGPGTGDLFFMGLDAVDYGVSGTRVLHTAPAGEPFPDLRYMAAAVARSEDGAYSALAERSDFTPPATLAMDSFFSLIQFDPVQGGTLSYSDAYNPGVSPAPDLQVSRLSLVVITADILPCSAVEYLEARKTFWTIYAQGDDLSFDLPVLPESAPVTLPDPEGTPDVDWLEWMQTSVALGLEMAFDFDDYAFDSFDDHVTAVSRNAMTNDTVPAFTFDSDEDEIDFPYDNCPKDYNPGQADQDSDGIGDDCDNCHEVYDPSQADSDGDGYGDVCEIPYGDLEQFGAADGELTAGDINVSTLCTTSVLTAEEESVELLDVSPFEICDDSATPILVTPNPDGVVDSSDLTVLTQEKSGIIEFVPFCR